VVAPAVSLRTFPEADLDLGTRFARDPVVSKPVEWFGLRSAAPFRRRFEQDGLAGGWRIGGSAAPGANAGESASRAGRRVNPVGLERPTAHGTESWKIAIAKDIGFLALIFWPLALTWGFPFGPGPGVLAWLLGGAAEVLWLVVLAVVYSGYRGHRSARP